MYNDIGVHPFPSQSIIDNFHVELKEYYLKVFEHLETGCDIEPPSESVIRLCSQQQQSSLEAGLEVTLSPINLPTGSIRTDERNTKRDRHITRDGQNAKQDNSKEAIPNQDRIFIRRGNC